MDGSEAILQLVDNVYNAALDPSLWTEFLANLTTALRSEKAGTHFKEPGLPFTAIAATANYDPHYITQFQQYHHTRNVWISPADPMKVGEFEKQLSQLLIPHLERAFQLHFRIAELEMHKHACHDALDRLPVGICISPRPERFCI
jgi:uncharacterized protein with NAD-binding domain and iron-sulfur cluster